MSGMIEQARAKVASGGIDKQIADFTFSTKYADETGLSYYGFRFYSVYIWLSRDPIKELGGFNQYIITRNIANSYDILGLKDPNLEAGWLALLYILQLLDNFTGDRIPPVLHFRSKALANRPEVKDIINNLPCGKEGIYPVIGQKQMKIKTGFSGFVFGEGTLSYAGIVTVVKDEECKSCYRYFADISFVYKDQLDWRSIDDGDWPKEMSKDFWVKFETLLDKIFDKFGKANFNYTISWDYNKEGCCP